MRKPRTLDELMQAFLERLESGNYTAREALACQPIIEQISEFDFNS